MPYVDMSAGSGNSPVTCRTDPAAVVPSRSREAARRGARTLDGVAEPETGGQPSRLGRV